MVCWMVDLIQMWLSLDTHLSYNLNAQYPPELNNPYMILETRVNGKAILICWIDAVLPSCWSWSTGLGLGARPVGCGSGDFSAEVGIGASGVGRLDTSPHRSSSTRVLLAAPGFRCFQGLQYHQREMFLLHTLLGGNKLGSGC